MYTRSPLIDEFESRLRHEIFRRKQLRCTEAGQPLRRTDIDVRDSYLAKRAQSSGRSRAVVFQGLNQADDSSGVFGMMGVSLSRHTVESWYSQFRQQWDPPARVSPHSRTPAVI